MARPKRFELLTPRFVVWCSIQLSYGRAGSGAAIGTGLEADGGRLSSFSPADKALPPAFLRSVGSLSCRRRPAGPNASRATIRRIGARGIARIGRPGVSSGPAFRHAEAPKQGLGAALADISKKG